MKVGAAFDGKWIRVETDNARGSEPEGGVREQSAPAADIQKASVAEVFQTHEFGKRPLGTAHAVFRDVAQKSIPICAEGKGWWFRHQDMSVEAHRKQANPTQSFLSQISSDPLKVLTSR